MLTDQPLAFSLSSTTKINECNVLLDCGRENVKLRAHYLIIVHYTPASGQFRVSALPRNQPASM